MGAVGKLGYKTGLTLRKTDDHVQAEDSSISIIFATKAYLCQNW